MIVNVEQQAERIEEINPLKRIELAGRTCYKSEGRITDSSYLNFCEKMYKNNHKAMLEFGSIILLFNGINPKNFYFNEQKSIFADITVIDKDTIVMSCNLRNYLELFGPNLNKVLLNNLPPLGEFIESICSASSFSGDIDLERITAFYNIESLLKCVDVDNQTYYKLKYHHTFFTAKVLTDRAIANEFVRHRVLSYAQESTRYCNYSQDKFEGHIKCIAPQFNDKLSYTRWLNSCSRAIQTYLDLTNSGEAPQQARDVLPLSLATTLNISGPLYKWSNFFNLRYFETTGKAHPKMKQLATMLFEECLTPSERELFKLNL